MPEFFDLLHRPNLHFWSRCYWIVPGLGLLVAAVGLTAGARIRMWFVLAAGLSPFVAIIVALGAKVGFKWLFFHFWVGAWVTMSVGLVLLVLFAVEYFYRNASKVPLRSWLDYTGPTYKVWSLTYTRIGLITLIFWLLWGDLVFGLSESVYPNSMSLQLDRTGIPKWWFILMTTTLGEAVNFLMVPIVSVWSDRCRSRFGRRIPFILATIVPLCLCIALLGYSDSIAHWARTTGGPARFHLSPDAAIIIIISFLILIYVLSNVFVQSVYWYLFRDVVPAKYLGRFMSAFRIVGICGGVIISLAIMPIIETKTRQIYLGAALLYFFGFGLMCLMVKEGQYPPPHPRGPTDSVFGRIWHEISTYARQCFVHPLFIMYYATTALGAMGGLCGLYYRLYYVRHLGFSTAFLGRVQASLAPLAFVLTFPVGWLVDRIHPLRVNLIAATLGIPFAFVGFFLRDYTIGGVVIYAWMIFIIWQTMTRPLLAMGEGSGMPMQMLIFPGKEYGQFCSANAMTRHLSVFLGSLVATPFMGIMFHLFGTRGYAYGFLWGALFHCAAVCCLWRVYLLWKKHGAENFKYDPENPSGDLQAAPQQGFEVLLVAPVPVADTQVEAKA